MSDTISIGSNLSADNSGAAGGGGGGIVIEEVGTLQLTDFGAPRKIVLLNYTLAAISEDDRLLLGEIRTRGGDDWALAGKSVTDLGGSGNSDRFKYLDLALVPNVQRGQGGASVVFLVEKKNKERCITAHNITHGKILALGEEFSCYDKVNVLGKGVSHIVADINAAEPTVYSVSNLVRKLRLEDGGTNLKPTPARAQVPTEGQDGTLSVAVLGTSPTSSKQAVASVVISFRTKSASKNKFMIEWYQSKKDELSCQKCAVKTGDDCEPAILLSDPKDPRSSFALCRNRSNGTTSLYKLTRGRRLEEPIAVFNHEVELAALGMSAAPDQNVTLITMEASREVARIYTLQKTEGFRGRHPVCGQCPALNTFSCHSHILSCSSHRWQLPISLVDLLLGPRPSFQAALVTLVDQSGRYLLEPETGLPYRLRILGCETQGFTPLAILLEDLERTHENAEDKLAAATLKICLNTTPCRDSVSHLSAWLMSGKIATVEMYYVKTPPGSAGLSSDGGSSDRLVAKPISADRFRGYITDIDWSQMSQRQGTFTLDQSPAPAPTPAAVVDNSASPTSSPPVNGGDGDHDDAGRDKLKSLVDDLTISLKSALNDNHSLRSNLESLQSKVDEVSNAIRE